MTLIAHRGRCPRCGSDPQGNAEFRAALAAQQPPRTEQAEAMAQAAHKAVQAFVDLVANNEDYEIEEYRRLSKQHSEAVVFAINNLRDMAASRG